MHICNDFDKYRDGELGSSERNEFESHLAVCESCRAKSVLLNNLVYVLKKEELRPLDMADRIAHRAFHQDDSWAALIVSWMRPGPVLAALGLVLVLFSFLWIMPASPPTNGYSEYDKLMSEADATKLMSTSQIYNNSEFMDWLVQEGN